MFGNRFRLFRLLGIPVYLDLSWFLVLALVAWSLSARFSLLIEGLAPATAWAMGLATAAAFFACIVLHELGHAVAARAFGVPTRGITLFLFGGVAELGGEPPSALSELVVALAGPLVTLVLAAGFFVAALAAAAVPDADAWRLPLEYLAGINLTVLVFNLVPAFPLDGGRVLRAALWGALGNLRRATAYAASAGRVFAWVLMGLGVLGLVSGQLIGGLWLVLIGLFLANAARAGYEQVVIREALAGEPVRRFMTRDPITVAPDVRLADFVEDYVYRHRRKLFPVADAGRLVGWVDTAALARVPRERWESTPLSEVMSTELGMCAVTPQTDALEALRRLNQGECGRLMVVEDGRLVGLVSQRDLSRFLELKLELEGDEAPPARAGHHAGPPPLTSPAPAPPAAGTAARPSR